MARTKQFPARVNIVLRQETYDAYKEVAGLLDVTIPQLMREMIEGGLPNMRKLAEAARVAKQQSPVEAGELLLKYFGDLQLQLGDTIVEGRQVIEDVRQQQQQRQPKRKAS